MKELALKDFLDKKAAEFNRPLFIKDDPISIPHLFTKKQDIEIAGFFAAIFSWGNRKTIIRKSKELMELMDMQPHTFCMDHDESRLKKLLNFKHRTFNSTDLLYFLHFIQTHYTHHESLEQAITRWMDPGDATIEKGLNGFYNYFFSMTDVPGRTKKHIASPDRRSTCKRLNMFLRWMVRQKDEGVDFGLWKDISPAQLVCPVDLHVARVSRSLKLINRKQTDWLAAMELTTALRNLDRSDPVKYDFALFGLGVNEKYSA